ncbi:hypothetical protein AAC387_Pa07g1901 [Persea americana]
MTELEGNPPIPNPVVTSVPHRSGRIVRPPDRLSFLGESYKTIPEELEEAPCNYNEAINDIDSRCWKEVMKAEMESMYSNQVWTLADLPANNKPIGASGSTRGREDRTEEFRPLSPGSLRKGILRKKVSTMRKPSRQ